jgi:hypothetical protein
MPSATLDATLPLKILSSAPLPNPNPTGFDVEIQGRCEEATLSLYSPGMRLLAKSKAGALGPGWVTIPMPAGFTAGAASGLYYYHVDISGAGQHAGYTGKFFILK